MGKMVTTMTMRAPGLLLENGNALVRLKDMKVNARALRIRITVLCLRAVVEIRASGSGKASTICHFIPLVGGQSLMFRNLFYIE